MDRGPNREIPRHFARLAEGLGAIHTNGGQCSVAYHERRHDGLLSLLPRDEARSVQTLFIDALNLAYWCGRTPSLRVPLALARQVLQQGHRAALYFDASARHRLADESEWYAELLRYPEFCIGVAKGIPADRELLKQANRHGACIVSRDRFRDHRKRYRRLIDDPARLCTGIVSNERLLIPTLGIDIALPASVAAAWSDLQPLLAAARSASTADTV
jgi:hypothetical protein